jgi:uncharacterized protein (TIGR02145 family)
MAKEKLRKRIAGNRIYATVAEKDRNLDNIVMADKADKVASATNNHLAALDASGNLKDSTKSAADFATAAQGTLASTAVQDVKLNSVSLTKDGNNAVDIPLMTGATASSDGALGLVPVPLTGDQGKFLKGDGTWDSPPEVNLGRYYYDYENSGLSAMRTSGINLPFAHASLVGCSGNVNDYTVDMSLSLHWANAARTIFSINTYSENSSFIRFGVGRGEQGRRYLLPKPVANRVAMTDASSNIIWGTISPYAPVPSADNTLLLGDATGGKTWTALENDVFGTQLLDENDQPVLDEQSTEDNPIYVYDAGSTDQLWTGFAGKGFGAIRAYADQDGHNIKATYLKKEDLPEMDEATDTEIDNMFTVVIGGRTYRTVTIGNQEWLAENLDYQFDYNGSPLPINETGNPSTPAAWYYNNDDGTTYGIDGTYKCGLLYNQYAVCYLNEHTDTLLPDGWHVPMDYEWRTMFSELTQRVGPADWDCGYTLKAANSSVTANWPSGWDGTNMYGFSVLPAGRYSSSFNQLGSTAAFWTPDISVIDQTGTSIRFGYDTRDPGNYVSVYSNNPSTFGWGYSLRLVRTIS